MVPGVGAVTLPEEGRCVYTAAPSGCHVGGAACVGGDGRGAGTGGGLQHEV